MPGGEDYDKLLALIRNLSSSYRTPPFEPHISLLGGLVSSEEELMLKAEELASSTQPFAVELDGIGHMDEYYMCLFAKVKENEALMELNRRAKEIFGRVDESSFIPHVSLIYANMRASKRRKIISSIEDELRGMRFKADRLYLYVTEGEPPDWYEAANFSFSPR